MNSFSNYNSLLETDHTHHVAVARRWVALAWRLPVSLVALGYLVLPSLLSLLSIRWLNAMPHGFVNLEVLAIGAAGVEPGIGQAVEAAGDEPEERRCG